MPSLTDLYNDFRNRLSKQHFGKDQSVIWSTINDPGMAAQKAGDYLQDSYRSAGDYDPFVDREPTQAIESALGLSGLLQSGALTEEQIRQLARKGIRVDDLMKR